MDTDEKGILEQKKLRGMRLGRIAGTGVYLDWSWLVIFLLILWNVGSFIVPQVDPNGSVYLYLGLGAAAAVLFLAGVLAHELAHAAAARQAGIEVRRISLFFFGGVTSLEKQPRSAESELRIAIVGPLASLALGVIFVFAGYAGRIPPIQAFINPQLQAPGSSPVGAVLQWLGSVNILIGLLNMIPAFPLDGGRVLHALLWSRTQNLRTATRWTLMAGQGISGIMLALGAAMAMGFRIPLLGSGIMNGMWLALGGWFLLTASAHTSPEDKAQEQLEGVPVESLMRRSVPQASPGMPLRIFIGDRIMKSDEPVFPVIYQDKLVGIVTMNEVQATPREKWEELRVAEIMIPRDKLSVISPATETMEALHRMTRMHLPQLAVVEGGRYVGMLVYTDILKWIKAKASEVGPRAGMTAERQGNQPD